MSISANRAQGSHLIISRHAAIQAKSRARIKPALPPGGARLVIMGCLEPNTKFSAAIFPQLNQKSRKLHPATKVHRTTASAIYNQLSELAIFDSRFIRSVPYVSSCEGQTKSLIHPPQAIAKSLIQIDMPSDKSIESQMTCPIPGGFLVAIEGIDG